MPRWEPIAVPSVCKKCFPLKLKLLFSMTKSIILRTSSVGIDVLVRFSSADLHASRASFLGTQQLLLKVLENQQEILKRIKTIEMEVKIKKTTEKPVDIKVPNGMKNAVKVGYKEGVRQGLKWQFEGKRVNDADNREMSDYITTFVKGWNSAYSDQTVINCALSRNFLTKRQEETAIKKDRLEGEKKRRAAYERIKSPYMEVLKAKRRLCALEKMELGINKKAKIMEVMKPAYMSPDEENGQDGFITHQPSWQSSKFKDYKSKLDNAYKNVCSKASLRLLQKRTIGNQSQKDVTQLAENCQWIVRDAHFDNTCLFSDARGLNI
ncbi:unnamed protein product [Mytilus edulis]|uniref:Uncharacterized protein n=1 Tax=Mytilus edulis TaxID=6550 RepID=A0A8S3PNC2_MYTED|nr:unnamed protein product [Mytilus edulis]